MSVLESWREQLGAWAIPEHILAAAPDSPWVLPHTVFLRRADHRIAHPAGASYQRAVEALREPGSVLDVGSAAGAGSLPLHARLTGATAVDVDATLLSEYANRAAALGVPVDLVNGRWPEVADRVEPADVVICAHVLYNVPDLTPFVAALSAHARRRVVVEVSDRHPLTTLNPLWRKLHGLDRPEGPTAEDALAALREIGVRPQVDSWRTPTQPEYESFAEMVDVTRRRLCLPPDATAEVQRALLDLGVSPERPLDLGSSGRLVFTFSWDPAG